ncbi:hypothetical protein KIW84_075904, partial [Lathyrus oleraceus]
MVSFTDPSLEDTDFSETINFISQILMEENVDHTPFYDPFSLQITEKSFYDALLHQNKPISPNHHPLHIHNPNGRTSLSDGLIDLDSVSLFKRGLEEANKFLPP